jgi:hypothetical protein
VPVTAIPYLAWANRGTDQGNVGPMRVWIPTS